MIGRRQFVAGAVVMGGSVALAGCSSDSSADESEDGGEESNDSVDDGSNDSIDNESNDSVDEEGNDSVDEEGNDSVDEEGNDSVDDDAGEGGDDDAGEGGDDGADEGSDDGSDEGSDDGSDEGSDDGADEGSDDDAGKNQVSVAPDGDWRFDPEELTVSVGETVTWSFEAPGHNVSSHPDASDRTENPDGAEPFASYEGNAHVALAEAGTTFEHTFDVAGEYVYVCVPHDGTMIGTIRVEE